MQYCAEVNAFTQLYLSKEAVLLTCRILFAPITFPISLLLDKWLGRDIGTVYSQEELKRLM